MFSAFFGSSQVDEFIDRATAETLPVGQEDIGLNLEISDYIRSKKFPAKEVTIALRRRLRNANPIVQLLTLSLTDTCVKNGGNHFLVEIASREFMDDLVSILKAPTSPNLEVQNKMLEHIQNWAEAFKSKPELAYTGQVYGALKAQGYTFPQKPSLSSALIDTKTAPEWTDSEVCMRCRNYFTMTNRKHHCRNCGLVFCHTCSTNNLPLPHFGINEPVRVCIGCYLKLKKVSSDAKPISLSEFIATEPKSDLAAPNLTSAPSNLIDNDADLQKAIQLSLQEAKQSMPSKSVSFADTTTTIPSANPASEDADLAAAIAASLEEMKISESKFTVNTYPELYQSSNPQDSEFTTSVSSHTLSERESSKISQFSKLVEPVQKGIRQDFDPLAHTLYSEICTIAPKLALSLQDANYKHSTFVELHSKLSNAVKLYDNLLERSLSANPYAGIATPSYEPYSPSLSSSSRNNSLSINSASAPAIQYDGGNDPYQYNRAGSQHYNAELPSQTLHYTPAQLYGIPNDGPTTPGSGYASAPAPPTQPYESAPPSQYPSNPQPAQHYEAYNDPTHPTQNPGHSQPAHYYPGYTEAHQPNTNYPSHPQNYYVEPATVVASPPHIDQQPASDYYSHPYSHEQAPPQGYYNNPGAPSYPYQQAQHQGIHYNPNVPHPNKATPAPSTPASEVPLIDL